MNFHQIIRDLLTDTKGADATQFIAADSSIGLFLPEIVLCVTMVAMLMIRIPKAGRYVPMWTVALVGSILAFALAAPWQLLEPDLIGRREIFTGMLVYDGFTVFMRAVLVGFVVLFILMTKLTGIPDNEDGPDIYTLVLGATLGMCLMVSANHLLIIFLAVEMASVPSYVLAGLLKGRRKSSEAALKYSVYGAGAAGVMLYGISLIAGLVNSAHLPTIALLLSYQLPTMGGGEQMALALGGLMIGVGLAFKLSAVPFHFWCPDVFEGASAEVAAFLSVASKAAALGLLVRVAIGFGVVPAHMYESPVVALASENGVGLFSVPDEPAASTDDEVPPEPHVPATDIPDATTPTSPSDNVQTPAGTEPDATETTAAGEVGTPAPDTADTDVPPDTDEPQATVGSADGLENVRSFIAKLVAFMAVVTCTFGNLTAYGQTNIKRLLAYSTIAHAGYMMMAVPPVMASISAGQPEAAERAVGALSIYVAIYLFMNLGAFAVVAFLRNAMKSEEIADYAGLIKRSPLLVICFALMLFSLVGLPPLAGFIGKFAIFAAVAEAYGRTGEMYLMLVLVLGGMNTAVSLFYYLRVVATMTMSPEPEDRPPFEFSAVSLAGLFVCLLTIPTLILIVIGGDQLTAMAMEAARHLL